MTFVAGWDDVCATVILGLVPRIHGAISPLENRVEDDTSFECVIFLYIAPWILPTMGRMTVGGGGEG